MRSSAQVENYPTSNMSFTDDILPANIYSEARDDGYGHTVVLCRRLDDIKPDSEMKEAVISHLIRKVAEALEISGRQGHKRSYVHVHMGGCFLKHYSAGFYKRLFKKLDSTYEDTLEVAYVYDAPPVAKRIWNVLKLFVEPETRRKVHMV